MPLSKKIIGFTILIMIANIFILYYLSISIARITRVITVIFYFLIFLGFSKVKDRFLILFFITLIIADTFNVFYENPVCRKLNSLFKLSGYLLLIYSIIDKVKFLKSNTIFKVAFMIIIGLNLVTIVYMVNSVSSKTNDILELILILIYALVILGLCAVAANYNFRFNNKRSKYFAYFCFAFLFTDVTGFLGYFLNYEYLFYGTKAFYLGALLFLVFHGLFTKEEEDILLEEDSLTINET